MKRTLVILQLTLMVFFLVGCAPEKVARDAIASAKGVIETAQAKYHDTCTADPTQSQCVSINKLVAGQGFAIDTLNVYCAGPEWDTGAVCTPHKELESKLREAVANLEREKTDVKGLIK